MRTTTEISKDDFIRRFTTPIVENMTRNLRPEIASSCNANVKIVGKTGKQIDFKAIVIEVEVPDEE